MADEKLGDKKFKKAKQNITISIFNWSKDYASAASQFDQALQCYQKAKNYDKCLLTLRELIHCNEKNLDNWAMGRNYETIIEIYLNHFPNIDIQTLKKDATAGFIAFRMAESLDKGLSLMGRVTKHLIQRKQLKQGVQLLHQAYKISLEDQKSFKRTDIFNQIIETYLENGIYSEAERMNGVDCEQMGLIVLILILIQSQPKRAQAQMYELSNMIPTFLSSNECQAADNLINFYKKGQPQQFKKQTTKAAITTLFPLIIIRKLRQVVVPCQQMIEKGTNQQKDQIMKDLLF